MFAYFHESFQRLYACSSYVTVPLLALNTVKRIMYASRSQQQQQHPPPPQQNWQHSMHTKHSKSWFVRAASGFCTTMICCPPSRVIVWCLGALKLSANVPIEAPHAGQSNVLTPSGIVVTVPHVHVPLNGCGGTPKGAPHSHVVAVFPGRNTAPLWHSGQCNVMPATRFAVGASVLVPRAAWRIILTCALAVIPQWTRSDSSRY